MNYWIVWPVGIVLWLIIGWFEFGYFESKALSQTAKPNQITLSMFIYTVGRKFPLSLVLGGMMIGLFFGILFTHLEWHWCPPGSISAG